MVSDLKEGDIFYKRQGIFRHKCYIVKMIRKELHPVVVYKWYNRNKQYWEYEVDYFIMIDMEFRYKTIALSRKEIIGFDK